MMWGCERPVYVANDFAVGDRIIVDRLWRGTVEKVEDRYAWPIDVELTVRRDGAPDTVVVFPNVTWVEWEMPEDDEEEGERRTR